MWWIDGIEGLTQMGYICVSVIVILHDGNNQCVHKLIGVITNINFLAIMRRKVVWTITTPKYVQLTFWSHRGPWAYLQHVTSQLCIIHSTQVSFLEQAQLWALQQLRRKILRRQRMVQSVMNLDGRELGWLGWKDPWNIHALLQGGWQCAQPLVKLDRDGRCQVDLTWP